MLRKWHILVRDSNGVWLGKDIYDRDEMAAFLMDLDMRGFTLRKWTFQCFASTTELVNVNLTFEFANWSMSNILDEMPQILGQEGSV